MRQHSQSCFSSLAPIPGKRPKKLHSDRRCTWARSGRVGRGRQTLTVPTVKVDLFVRDSPTLQFSLSECLNGSSGVRSANHFAPANVSVLTELAARLGQHQEFSLSDTTSEKQIVFSFSKCLFLY